MAAKRTQPGAHDGINKIRKNNNKKTSSRTREKVRTLKLSLLKRKFGRIIKVKKV